MLRKRIAPGKKPASATPRRKRSAVSWVKVCTKVNSTATMPQLIMIRASQRRAPNLLRARLLGTSSTM